ncbi:MAG: PAC2 family protein [Solirubrobacteraceae bacterium]|nr:PAC2 family protein [Solirubrobacteraceae bacterium]
MIPLRWDDHPVGLRDPALVCAFTGWTDAGDAASSAVGVMIRRLGAKRCASVDPELLYTMQAYRPQLRLRDGVAEDLTWPTVELHAAVLPDARRDLLLLAGPEPSMRWRSLAETVVETARSLGASFVLTLGGLLSDVPHTRPVPLTGLATDTDVLEPIGAMLPDYDGPTGLTGVVHHEAARQGLAAASLLAHVPHYVAGVPSPKATLALVEAAELLTSVEVPTRRLREASDRYVEQVTAAVERDPERRELLERLEQMADLRDVVGEGEIDELLDGDLPVDDITPLSLGEIPSGDALAHDFQRFLRDQQPPGGDADEE